MKKISAKESDKIMRQVKTTLHKVLDPMDDIPPPESVYWEEMFRDYPDSTKTKLGYSVIRYCPKETHVIGGMLCVIWTYYTEKTFVIPEE